MLAFAWGDTDSWHYSPSEGWSVATGLEAGWKRPSEGERRPRLGLAFGSGLT